jgi:hypothetical protein
VPDHEGALAEQDILVGLVQPPSQNILNCSVNTRIACYSAPGDSLVALPRLQTLEECEYRCIDLLNALQLYPVPTARKDGLAEIRDELLHPFDPSARTHHFRRDAQRGSEE